MTENTTAMMVKESELHPRPHPGVLLIFTLPIKKFTLLALGGFFLFKSVFSF
jgi:hypothetical protein